MLHLNRTGLALTLSFIFVLLASCTTGSGLTPEESWAQQTLESLTLRQKVGQMMVYHMNLHYLPEESDKWQEIESILGDEGIGFLHIWRGELGTAVGTLNEMQSLSKVPIIVQGDLEYGLNARFEGGTHLPWPMAQTATGDPGLAYEAGRITAEEGRAIGFHLNLAPVADVNNNPFNPIINIRAYSEDPDEVIKYAGAFLEGMQDHGMAGTAKHFPGHGDTDMDSHSYLSVIPNDSTRLWDVELKPFKALIDRDVDLVMVGHLDAGAFQHEPGMPATLSPYWLNDVLRDQLGFEGLIMTDNMGMGGITNHYTDRQALIMTINAGADVIIQNYKYRYSVNTVVEAVEDGLIPIERIDEAVFRILNLKAKVGLHRKRTVDFGYTRDNYGKKSDVAIGREIIQSSITLVQDRDSLIINDLVRTENVHVIDLYDRPHDKHPTRLVSMLQKRELAVKSYILDTDDTVSDYNKVLASIPDEGLVILNAFCSIQMNKDRIFFPPSQQQFVEDLSRKSSRLILVSFGTPYLLYAFPEIGTYIAAYGGRREIQEAVARSLLGEAAITGKLPVSIPGLSERGNGINIEKRHEAPAAKPKGPTAGHMVMEQSKTTALSFVDPVDIGADVSKVMTVMRQALDEQAWPGGVLVAGQDGKVFLNEYFGTHTYENERRTYRVDLFDLASVSKVVGTTTAAMILYEEGLLDLDTSVVAYLPRFVGPDSIQTEWKKLVTPRHLLTHTSGLAPFRLFFKMEAPDQEARFDSVFQSPLDTLPGIQYAYSDIGMITMGKVIESISGMGLDEYLQQKVFGPLGMIHTGYTPTHLPQTRIVPTEYSDWADELIRGYVHDENSHSLGGVTGHAGLFSTGTDLARYCQMMLNGGILDTVRILQPETIAEFIVPAGIVAEGYGSTRTLGWGGPWEDSSGGIYVDSTAIGHTGYTGTSVWIDPANDIFVILLTNAVHPHRTWKYPNYFDWRHLVHSKVYESVGLDSPNPELYWGERWQREQALTDPGWFEQWKHDRWLKNRLKGRKKF